jgi:hypothetical protein
MTDDLTPHDDRERTIDLSNVLRLHGMWWPREHGGQRADLRGAKLPCAELQDAQLQRADLRGANLQNANLRGANLGGAELRNAKLWGADLREAKLWVADLRGAKLQGVNLQLADLQRADLRDAELQFADLRSANLGGANLRDADLRGADLRFAKLRGAKLQGATLPEGVTWEQYVTEVVPALLVAGGRPLAEVATAEHWACHDWTNCPMHAAFGATNLAEVPAAHRNAADVFIQRFDAGLLPLSQVTP